MSQYYTSRFQVDTSVHDYSEIKFFLDKRASKWKWARKVVYENGKPITLRYLCIPASFDIETSSFDYNCNKVGCLTCWQLGLDGTGFIGRTWEQLKETFELIRRYLGLNDRYILPIYVHNLSYEFQWTYRRFKYTDVFSSDNRKPFYARFNGIELRDSLILSGCGLANVGEKLLHKYKVVTKTKDWDYRKIRTTETPLTDEEKRYAINDVLVVMEYIKEKMEDEDDNITKIPMTRTGYVRRDVRERCLGKDTYKSSKYYKFIHSLNVGVNEYKKLKQTFMGGFTHASHFKVNKVLENVGSFDFTSSYPSVMVCEKFPMGIFKEGVPESYKEFEYLLSNYCCMFFVRLNNVTEKIGYEHPISSSKCINARGIEEDNGRVIRADQLSIWITECDWEYIKEFYKFDSFDILDFTAYYKEYLPKEIVDAVLFYYEQKTTLKDVSGRELEYALYKEMVNAIYGMMVMDIVRPEIEFNGSWLPKSEPDYDKCISSYNKSKKRFLYYPWGVWITAYARRNLMRGIKAAGNNYNYSDTDSIKYDIDRSDLFLKFVEEYNNSVKEKMETAMDYHGFDKYRWCPENSKGVKKPLGYWDDDGKYDKFKTLGAKRYFVLSDGKYKATVAGVSKKKVCEYLVNNFDDPMEGFDFNLVVPMDKSGRLISTYVDEDVTGEIIDKDGVLRKFCEKSLVNLSESEYAFDVSENFLNYVMDSSILEIYD